MANWQEAAGRGDDRFPVHLETPLTEIGLEQIHLRRTASTRRCRCTSVTSVTLLHQCIFHYEHDPEVR